MLIYLDSNVVIYAVENTVGWGPRAMSYFAALRANLNMIIVSELTRMECRVKPLKLGDHKTLAEYDAFFTARDVHVTQLGASVFERATAIRARHGYPTVDALHLAAAIEAGCGRFCSNDARLSGFPDITVEMLP